MTQFKTALQTAFIFGVTLTASSELTKAATLCVNSAASSGCMATIGAAVAAASPGDSINVAAGTYKEMVTVGKPLSLVGADSSKTIIDATGLANGIYVDGIDNKLTAVAVSGTFSSSTSLPLSAFSFRDSAC